jgi:HAD superfamily hydrolase (TIGR01490 family)
MGDNRLAVFDLDGTLTRRDTFAPYLRGWLARHPGRRRPIPILVAIGRYFTAGRDRGRLKSDLIRACMGGASRHEVQEWTDAFVAALDGPELCPGALAAIARHRAAGDRLVLLSASVDLYVAAIGKRFGFEETICTGIAWLGDRLDGALTTPNRRGVEKKRCIEDLRHRFPGAAITAYGNATSDLAHLAAVEHPMLVNGSPSVRRKAARIGVPAADWRNKCPRPPVQSA